jgi:glycosyltransferase 2 family protein
LGPALVTGGPGTFATVSSGRLRTAAALLGIPIGLVFLWLAVRNADADAVWDTLRDADMGLVALAIGAFGVVYLLQAVRWRQIAATPTVSVPRFYEMTVTGIAVNNVLPGRIGDFLRARWLGREARMPYGTAFGTVILDRAFDVVVLVGLLIVGISAVASSAWLWQLAAAGSVLVLGIAGVLLFSRVYIGKRERDRHERGLVRRLVRDTVERLAEPFGRRLIVIWLGLSTLAWSMWAVAAYLVARSLGIELSLTEALFVTAVVNLGSAVPSSPGFVGTYEWLGVAALGLLDVDHESALAFTILTHAAWYVPTTLFGAVALGLRWVAGVRRRRVAIARIDRASR